MRGRTRVLALVALVVLAGCTVAVEESEPAAETRGATVTDVIDGDTVDVRFADGERETVRLLGVDAPETDGDVSPDEFAGVPDTAAGRECLRAAAADASAFARERLAGREVTVRTDPAADRYGGYGRLLAYVTVDGADRSFNRALLDRGHARVYVTEFGRLASFRDAAESARAANRGLWACAP